ncbi:MAG TPA: hypothetical protein VK843_13885 [Planctomycetota bacterium]|nr:hypothetical protein [Planctomycetota bacterium]
MKCFHCEETARANCQFCGRAVCREHIQKKSFFSGYKSVDGIFSFKATAVEVSDASWCGSCRPEYRVSG